MNSSSFEAEVSREGTEVVQADGKVVAAEEAVVADKPQEDGEEARMPRIARRPITPTKAQVDAHRPLHYEFRE